MSELICTDNPARKIQELTEALQEAYAEIGQLTRCNYEWQAVWQPVDDFVRPMTTLGESVAKKTLSLVKIGAEHG
jgi:hypothetical protein